MKNFKVVMMLTLIALLSQNSVAMDEKQVSADAKGLIHDLNAYRKCRNTEQGCPQELIDRLQNRGIQIAKGVALVVGTAAVGYAGTKLYGRQQQRRAKWQGKWRVVYNNLLQEFKFEGSASENNLVRNAFQGNEKALEYVKRTTVSKEAIDAAIFIAKENGHTQLARQIEQAAK